jgi:hypothetical protein
MTPAEALASHRAMINEIGEDVIIRRYTGTGPARSYADRTTKARVMGYQPRELVGSIEQGDVKAIALVDALADLLPITTSDTLIVRGKERAIKTVDDNTRRVAGTLIALELQVTG